MTQTGNIYTADEGMFIVRKADGFIMGEEIDLGSADSIDNYEEQPYTEESYNAFYEGLGIEPRKKFKKKETEEEVPTNTNEE